MSLESIFELLSDCLPSDHSAQVTSTRLVEDLAKKGLKPSRVLDVGCGVGASKRFFEECLPESKWTGIDIASSPEVNARKDNGSDMLTYNGVNIPFQDGYFDLIYSNQVFEHVRYPEKLLAEIFRTLAAGGLFVGQTSQLEPYHSFSLWNFTVFGFQTLCKAVGLQLIELRPGIDSLTLIERSYKGRPKSYSKWFTEQSPLNQEIETEVRSKKRSTKVVNFRKLLYCGQFCFIVKKPSENDAG